SCNRAALPSSTPAPRDMQPAIIIAEAFDRRERFGQIWLRGFGERLREGVAQSDGADEDRIAGSGIPVAAEIAEPLELHRLVGVRRDSGRLQHAAGEDFKRGGVE